MGQVFDCRRHNVIKDHQHVEHDRYEAVLETTNPVVFDDLLITRSGDLLVVNDVTSIGSDQYKVSLLDVDMVINSNKFPQYRELKRAILSQIKRNDKK